MRIFCAKALKFDHPQGRDVAQPVKVRAKEFADVPDWVVDSNMFKLAIREENLVTVVNNKADELAAENGQPNSTNDSSLKALRAEAKELGIQDYSKLGKDELSAAIEAAKANNSASGSGA